MFTSVDMPSQPLLLRLTFDRLKNVVALWDTSIVTVIKYFKHDTHRDHRSPIRTLATLCPCWHCIINRRGTPQQELKIHLK